MRSIFRNPENGQSTIRQAAGSGGPTVAGHGDAPDACPRTFHWTHEKPTIHLIAVLREPLLRLILLIDADPLPPDVPVQFASAVQEAKRLRRFC